MLYASWCYISNFNLNHPAPFTVFLCNKHHNFHESYMVIRAYFRSEFLLLNFKNAFKFDIVPSELCCHNIIIIVWVLDTTKSQGRDNGRTCNYCNTHFRVFMRVRRNLCTCTRVIAVVATCCWWYELCRRGARIREIHTFRTSAMLGSFRQYVINSFWVRFTGDDDNRTFIMLFVSVYARGIFRASKRVDQ